MLVRYRHTDKLRSLDTILEWAPFMAGLVPFTGLLTNIIEMYRGRSHLQFRHGRSARSQRRLAELYLYLSIVCGLFFILLEASLVIRMLYNRYINELEAVAK